MRFINKCLFLIGEVMATRKPRKSPPSETKEKENVVIPRYFLLGNWEKRLEECVAGRPSTEGRDFATENAIRIQEHVSFRKSLRVVFNLGGYALLNYLRSGDYQNIYEQPTIAGKQRTPSTTRMDADSLVGLLPAVAYYFCALATGGTGIRYYGEYCAAIKPTEYGTLIEKVLDRNSYDLLTKPLSTYLGEMHSRGKGLNLIEGLMSRPNDGSVQQMLAAKVLQRTPDSPRLLSAGAVANAILSDEDYCEAYHRGKITLDSLEEIREHPADVSREGEILQRLEGGEPIRCEELVWACRRRLIRDKLRSCGIPRSMAVESGRSGRWE